MQSMYALENMAAKLKGRIITCYYGLIVRLCYWKSSGQQKRACPLDGSMWDELPCGLPCIRSSISFNQSRDKATVSRKRALNLVRALGLVTLVGVYIIITMVTIAILSLLLGWMADKWPYLNIIVTRFLPSIN